MSDSEDLFKLYTDRSREAPSDGDSVGTAMFEAARRTLSMMDTAAAEVEKALAKARYAIRVDPALLDRASYVRLDRGSEGMRDHFRNWGRTRGARGGSTHWEVKLHVTDTRRETAEIGLGMVIDGGVGRVEPEDAFVEFWTTGRGMWLPSGRSEFARALVESILRLESLELLRPAASRG